MRRFFFLALPFFGATLLAWAVLVGLVLAVSWVEGAGHLANVADGVWAALLLALLGAAQVAWQTLPVATLLGLVVASTQLARSGELLALLSLGVTPRQMAVPFVAVAATMAGLGWAMAERALPPLARQHIALLKNTTGRLDAATRAFGRTEHWFKSGERILFLPREGADDDATHARPQLLTLHNDRLVGVTDAYRLQWQDGAWQLEAPATLLVDPNVSGAREWATAPLQLPRLLGATHGAPQEQKGRQLRRLIARREAAGIVSTGHRLEALSRRAYPTLCLALVALMLPWALRPTRQRSLVAMLGAAAALTAATFATHQVGRLAVHAGHLTPLAGACLAPLVALVALPLSMLAAARR